MSVFCATCNRDEWMDRWVSGQVDMSRYCFHTPEIVTLEVCRLLSI